MAFVRSGAASKAHQDNPKGSHAPAADAGISDAGYLRLPHSVIVRAPGLLPMLYRPSELAEELDVAPATVRDWVDAVRQQPQKPKLGHDEAYCFRCRRSVELRDPVAQQHGKQMLLSGSCPHCGGTINRGGRIG